MVNRKLRGEDAVRARDAVRHEAAVQHDTAGWQDTALPHDAPVRQDTPVRKDAPVRDGHPRRAYRSDGGQAAIELAGTVFILLIAGLAVIQLGIAAYAVQQAGTASRAAARAASQYDAGWQQVGESSMSDWLAQGTTFTSQPGAEDYEVTAEVEIPSILPIFDLGEATRSTTMPMD